jgi:transcriptional regulator with XRE-family HTH domain
MTIPDAARLKRKILGVRLRSARTQVGLKTEEVAQQLGIAPAKLANYELGQQEASLPELEAMAKIFNLPVHTFWSNGPLKEADKTYRADRRIPIRRKIIGVQLRQAREKANQTIEDIAQALNCTPTDITDYELGKRAIPFSTLQDLVDLYQVPLTRFLENPEQATEPVSAAPPTVATPVAAEPALATPTKAQPKHTAALQSNTLSGDLTWMADLPEDVKKFMADPASLLYLRLAMLLDNVSTRSLRTIAEEILEITY